jgi:hypothetical protein
MQNIRKIKSEIKKQNTVSVDLVQELRNVCQRHAVNLDPIDIVESLMQVVEIYNEQE